MTQAMPRFRLVAGSALIVATALLAGCSQPSSTMSTQETASTAPPPAVVTTTDTHVRQ
jgi:uncharacterized lipoprotein YajG